MFWGAQKIDEFMIHSCKKHVATYMAEAVHSVVWTLGEFMRISRGT
jgi:hypothetical protein